MKYKQVRVVLILAMSDAVWEINISVSKAAKAKDR